MRLLECPSWRGFQIESNGKLLGFFVGPGAGDASWEKPLKGFRQRVQIGAGHRLGIHYNSIVFNVFAVSAFELSAQFSVPSDVVDVAMCEALRLLAPGPGNWCTIQDLANLKIFGFQHSFRFLRCIAQASKFRVAERLAPDLRQMCDEPFGIQAESTQRPFGLWHGNSFVSIFQNNLAQLQAKGVTHAKAQQISALVPPYV